MCASLAEQIPLDGTRSFQIHIFKFYSNSVSFVCEDGHNCVTVDNTDNFKDCHTGLKAIWSFLFNIIIYSSP